MEALEALQVKYNNRASNLRAKINQLKIDIRVAETELILVSSFTDDLQDLAKVNGPKS